MDSLMIMELVKQLNRDLELTLYPREVFERTSLDALAEYLVAELDKAAGFGTGVEAADAPAEPRAPLAITVAREGLTPVLPERRNPPAVFLLSSPRSGSTLLRVMLAGHPELFSPPELHLLPFDGMAGWAGALERSYLDEGVQRALMELAGHDAPQSKQMLAEWVEHDLPVHEAYRRLQQLAAPRTLIDKSPSYALDPDVLQRAELLFDRPKYIHLVRHPYAVIESIVRNRIDRVFEGKGTDAFASAEQIWSTMNGNTLDFLEEIEPERHHRVYYERPVADPEAAMRELCSFLDVPFVPELLAPYEGRRMTDGVHAGSLQIGDPNFLEHREIEPSLGDAWKRVTLPRRLSGFARRVAAELEYELPAPSPDPTTTAPPRRPEPSGQPGGGQAPSIQPVPRDGALALSFAQERMFVLNQMEPDAATFNVPAVVRLRGALDLGALQRSFDAVVRRHEALRSNLVFRDGRPVQEVAEPAPFELPVVDLRDVPDAEREARARQLAREEVRRPFELDRDVKLRARVLRMSDADQTLVVTMHHIASDAWSVGILLRELAELYSADVSGQAASLAALPV
jgi:hypothetical protein